MLNLPITGLQRHALMHALTWDHSISVQVLVMDLEDRVLADLSDRLEDGQVDGAQDGRFRSTAAKVVLWDPAHELRFDTASPVQGQLFADRMLDITYRVQVWWQAGVALPMWIDVPVFRGPVTAARRDGPSLHVDCLGKEALADKPAWKPVTYRKGSRITDAITDLLVRAGESPDRIAVPRWAIRLPRDRVIGPQMSLWEQAVMLGKSAGGWLMYHGDGIVRLAKQSENVLFTFRDGPTSHGQPYGPTVMSEPATQFETTDVVNVVRATGAPKPSGTPVVGEAALPRDHPLNTHRLGRHGSQWIKPEYIDDRDIRSDADAQARAEETLAARSREYVKVTFDSVPIPMLQAGDMCAVHTARQIVPTFRIGEYSLPLGHGGRMSIGTRRRVHDPTGRRWRR